MTNDLTLSQQAAAALARSICRADSLASCCARYIIPRAKALRQQGMEFMDACRQARREWESRH